MSIDRKEYEAGAAGARTILGKNGPSIDPKATAMTDRQREIMEHPLAQGRHKALAENLAGNAAVSVDDSIAALMAAATHEERGAAAARSVGYGKKPE